MTTLYDQAVPIINLPFYYINGGVLAYLTNAEVTLTAAICRDSTNTYDMNIGNFNGQVNQSAAANVTTTINCNVTGLNGLDTGSLGVSLVYYVYIVSDPVSGNPTGAIASLNLPSLGPLMPFGYSAYRLAGYFAVDGSRHIIPFAQYGINTERLIMYDGAVSVGTTVTEAAYTAVNLSSLIPLVNNTPVILQASISGTAGDTLSLQPGNATNAGVVIEAQVTAQATQQQVLVLAQNKLIMSVLSPTINYKNSGTDTIVLAVAGYWYTI